MKEFIEKLVGRLEEYKYTHLIEHNCEICKHCDEQGKDCVNLDCMLCVWDKAKVIVNQLAEEYSANTPKKSAGGWIPVTERLPKYDAESEYYEEVIVTLNNGIVTTGYYRNLDEEWWVQGRSMKCLKNSVYSVVAWQPFPKSYIPRGQWKDAVMNHFTKIE